MSNCSCQAALRLFHSFSFIITQTVCFQTGLPFQTRLPSPLGLVIQSREEQNVIPRQSVSVWNLVSPERTEVTANTTERGASEEILARHRDLQRTQKQSVTGRCKETSLSDRAREAQQKPPKHCIVSYLAKIIIILSIPLFSFLQPVSEPDWSRCCRVLGKQGLIQDWLGCLILERNISAGKCWTDVEIPARVRLHAQSLVGPLYTKVSPYNSPNAYP